MTFTSSESPSTFECKVDSLPYSACTSGGSYSLSNGTHSYASEAEIMIESWAIDDGPVQVTDRTALDAILDEALVAHVGVVRDGRPLVLPFACARDS